MERRKELNEKKCINTDSKYINSQECEKTDIIKSKVSIGVMNTINIENIPNNNEKEIRTQGMYNENILDAEDNDNCYIGREETVDKNNVEYSMPEGRRIVDISFMWNEIHRTFDNHARGIECQFKDWKLVNSRRCGLLTQLFFKCQMCHYEDNIWSEPINGQKQLTESEKLDANAAAAIGTVTIGIGYYQLEEVCAAINIPCMSEKTYIKHREKLVDDFQKTAMESMKKAGEMEKELAMERNETINGIPYITVIADGSWMKRSYGSAYNSLSGVGAIIGFRTRKVLFIGIRNKYCAICDAAMRQNVEARTHKCYKNFDRNVSSTSMESDAIVEGFKTSLEMHGLIYKTVVADGDSNVYQSIINNRPYREHMITVKKIECTNHLLRNLCRKLKTVSEITLPKLHRTHGFVQARKVVKSNILRIRKEIIEAAAIRTEEKQPQHWKATELQKDILNIPSHVFGEHKRCNERGRKCVQINEDRKTNYVLYLKQHGLYQKVENAIMYISAHSDSLLLNLTNNPAESFNSIICKEIGGKRINFGARGSYNARIAGAVVQYNTQQVLAQVHKSICNNIPPIIENLEKRRQIKVARTKESRQSGIKRKFKGESGTDHYYGPQSHKPDLSENVFEQLRVNHMNKLLENGTNWKKIERDTVGQHESELWQSLRREMLTASNFGTVCRMRPTTSCATTVKNILFPPSIDTAAMKYGREKEEIAKKEVAIKLNKKINACGLFIDQENPCLGASPDGVIDEDGLIEIKCPSSAEHLSAEEAIESQLKGIFDKKNPEKMNQNHRFFYQVQGQLNIAQRDYCIFVIWTPKSCKIAHVNRDIAFWKNRMLPFLTRFYYECMLPEILDSRHNRRMPIRNPKYILEAKEEACINKNGGNNRNIEKENISKPIKRLKQNVLSVTASITDITAVDTQKDDDCIIVSYVKNVSDLPKNEITKRKQILDDMIASLSEVRENVLPINKKLNDGSLDSLLRVIREKSCFETQSVLYIEYPDEVVASQSNKSLQIIGGNCTDHWRCIFFDGTMLHVYDSLPGCTYEKLVDKEKEYIRRRYPKITKNNISFEKVQTQPDYICCGIYAAAFATTVALGGNPCKQNYSNDTKIMRQHFMKIVEEKMLLAFPQV